VTSTKYLEIRNKIQAVGVKINKINHSIILTKSFKFKIHLVIMGCIPNTEIGYESDDSREP
jgi:hypothetical protein